MAFTSTRKPWLESSNSHGQGSAGVKRGDSTGVKRGDLTNVERVLAHQHPKLHAPSTRPSPPPTPPHCKPLATGRQSPQTTCPPSTRLHSTVTLAKRHLHQRAVNSARRHPSPGRRTRRTAPLSLTRVTAFFFSLLPCQQAKVKRRRLGLGETRPTTLGANQPSEPGRPAARLVSRQRQPASRLGRAMARGR